MHNFTIFAHRGGLGHGPENALSTIATSLALGVEAIEIDLWLVGQEIFVTHDRRLGRTIPGNGRLIDQCDRGLRHIALNSGEAIPTLRDVLGLIGDRAEINLELKGPNISSTLLQHLDQGCQDFGCRAEQFLISSFDHHQLRELQQLRPQIRRGVLIEGIPLDYAHCAEAVAAYSIHPSLDFLAPGLIDDAHRRGIKVLVYTVNESDDIEEMLCLGVDGIFTDYPKRAMEVRQRFLQNPISTLEE